MVLRPILDSARSSHSSYMREEVARVHGVASDEPSFRALDLNLEISVRRGKWCARLAISWRALSRRDRVSRAGAIVGDRRRRGGQRGRRRRRTGLVTGALRTWLAYGDTPTLTARAKRDGADYIAMQRRGELRTYPGRTVPVKAFVADVRADLAGAARYVMAVCRQRTAPGSCAMRCRGRCQSCAPGWGRTARRQCARFSALF